VLCCSAFLEPCRGVTPDFRLQVDEAATRISLGEHGLDVALAVVSPSAGVQPVRCEMDLLDPENTVVGHLVKAIQVEPATALLPMTLSVPGPGPKEARSEWADKLLWYRVRYRLTAAHPAATTLAQGILPVGNLLQNAFNLEIAAWRMDANQRGYQALVRATHPINGAPVEGVNLQASVTFDDSNEAEWPIVVQAPTDARGFATLHVDVSRADLDRDGKLNIEGHLGGYEQEAEQGFDAARPNVLITTDKPLYQPGQVVHVRTLVRNGSGRALAGAKVLVRIQAPSAGIVYESNPTTSRFGVAHADWTIPGHQGLGTYRIEVRGGQEDQSDYSGSASIRISRYELPQFTVSVKPDRAYYLPGQDARVEVHGDYLFGKPVPHGRVKVFGADERTWNNATQKFDVKAGPKYEGVADEKGAYTVLLDLQAAQKQLAEKENADARYVDVRYTASVTDPSTGRTEQRRFDLRATKEPIHVYLVGSTREPSWNLPTTLYVSTTYADGSPAECEVELRGLFEPARPTRKEVPDPGKLIATAHTSHYGLAKVSGLELRPGHDESDSFQLTLSARDTERRAGQQHYFPSSSTDDKALRVETDKTLYRDGEPIDAQVAANFLSGMVQVNVATAAGVVQSQQVELTNGRASVHFPYQPAFGGEVSVQAFVLQTQQVFKGEYWENQAQRTVLFPRRHGLNVQVALDRDTYRPGGSAQADFAVTGPNDQSVESDLGVVVFDKAVAERARTDQDFSGYYGFYYRPYSYFEPAGGVTRDDLDALDFSKPVPEGLDLVAEVMLANGGATVEPVFLDASSRAPNLDELFAKTINPEFKPLKAALDRRYQHTQEYPKDEAALRRFLSQAGLNLDATLDPWGIPYRTEFLVREAWDSIDFKSAGPDKEFGTDDDFQALELHWAYFRPQGDVLQRTFEDHHRRTGGYIRDLQTLQVEARKHGLDVYSLRDKWGQPYRFDFGIDRTSYTCTVESSGPNKRFENPDQYPRDDFAVWNILTDYSAPFRARIDAAITKYVAETGVFPQDEATFATALSHAGLDWRGLRDAWGDPYYVTFGTEAQYSDRITVRISPGAPGPREQITPVTSRIVNITLHSAGPDGKQDTGDDFVMARIDQAVSEQSGSNLRPVPLRSPAFIHGAGAISGTVTDQSGAVIPNAVVHATLGPDSKTLTTRTGKDGTFSFHELSPGHYKLIFTMLGFVTSTVDEVPVLAEQETNLDVTLAVGTMTQTVTVEAVASSLQAETSSELSVVSAPPPPPPPSQRFGRVVGGVAGGTMGGILGETPRLRQYFPETLVWQPELITDRNGRAQLKFNLADNITTWEMSVIGSTEDGEIGTAEKEFRAFQPFFLQLDPPPVLTQGDEIALPVVARNYLDKAVALDLEIAPADWFSLLSPAKQHIQIAAGESATQIFSFQATKKVADGRQRVTAMGSDASDAIERKVSVHPDGQEITETQNQLVGKSASLAFMVPKAAIPGSAEARIAIYPNLMAHVIAAIEGMLARPDGCTEQIISSTYPSLLLLQYYKLAGHADPALEARARGYLQLGYDRLLANQTAGGGFNYWGHGDPDVALTAYALRFLADASAFIPVDVAVEHSARRWLEKEQQKDGRWPAHLWYSSQENIRQSSLLTAYVAQVLAALPADSTTPASQTHPAARNPVAAALNYLRPKVDEIDEPYLIVAYTLAAMAEHDPAAAGGLKRLRTLAHPETRGTYWALETNTPFYGWGQAGRIETTALVVQALSRASQATPRSTEDQNLIDQGLLFLFTQKDRYGIWYSTQATVNVLQTLTLIACDRAKRLEPEPQIVSASPAEVMVNGRAAGKLILPPPDQPAGPVELNLSPFIVPGRNRIEIRPPESSSSAWVAMVGTHYEPWKQATESKTREATRLASTGDSSGLRLAVDYTSTQAKVGDVIICHVSAERVGFHGYGMLLAEIGLPPGSEVDRESLQHAAEDFKTGIGRYEVMPDRVVFYLWPQAGGSEFKFAFRPRFAERANSAPSVLYDYYNPEAGSEVPPSLFTIQ